MTPWLGIISDTHGLLRPEAIQALTGCELIIHAGDVGKPEILTQLAEIAPVHAVRGNVDRGELGATLPEFDVVKWNGCFIYVRHIIEELDIDPVAGGFDAVIYGHSHKPSVTEKAGVLYLNPGSAGPRRFSLPITVARITLEDGSIHAELVSLETDLES